MLEACRQEFHRRLKVYHQWKKKQNKARGVDPQGESQRAPQEIMQTVEGAPPLRPRPDKQEPVTPTALPPRRAQGFFRVPQSSRSSDGGMLILMVSALHAKWRCSQGNQPCF